MERVCPNCGTVTEDDLAQQCFNCSTPLPPIEDSAGNGKKEDTETDEEVTPLPDGQMYCPQCMTPAAVSAQNCINCNNELAHMQRCPTCTIGVDEIAEICPHCFNPISVPDEKPKGDPNEWDLGAVGGKTEGGGEEPKAQEPEAQGEASAEIPSESPAEPAEPPSEDASQQSSDKTGDVKPKKKKFGLGKKKEKAEEPEEEEPVDDKPRKKMGLGGFGRKKVREPKEEEAVAEGAEPRPEKPKRKVGFARKKAEEPEVDEEDAGEPEKPKRRLGFGRKKSEEEPAEDEDIDGDEGEPGDEGDADDEDLARQRREERKRKLKQILDEESKGSFFNYYLISLITLSFHFFMFIFVAMEFFLYAANITTAAPGIQFNFAPLIGDILPIAMLTFALILTSINAFLHYFDRKIFLWLSLVPTLLMMGSIGVTLSTWTSDMTMDIGIMFALFVLYLIMFVLDLIAIAKYPAVLEDPGRGQFELYLEKEDEIEKIRTEMQEETDRLLAEEEEKLKMKTEEMKEIEQHINELTERISKEEEQIRMKEDEISAIKSQLDLKNAELMEEEEKLRMKEEEMESLIKAEIDKRTESFVMEEEEKLRLKEEELIKTHSELDIQKNLFEENRDKLRLKEKELTTLKQELENEIRQRLEEEEKLKLKEAAARLVEKTKQKRTLFPFVALVGQEKMKRALVLNAIYPEIGGVLIRGQKGTGKSVGVRGLAEVLPDIETTACRYNCDPKDVDNLCEGCKAKHNAGKLESHVRPVQVVDLPLNITEDRLVGSIDIEKVLAEGVKAFEPGILAEAHRGILYVDEINLLDDYIVDILLDAASSGMVNVEREGISLTHPAKFIIVGSMNPEEGELRPQILDRIALQTDVIGIQDVSQRIDIVRRREKFTQDSDGFRESHEPARRELRTRITRAREILPNVTTPPNMLTLIARICVDFNVDGHRADIIIERAARANAAFEGRLEVNADDVAVGSEMALPHRMRRRPYEGEQFTEDVLKKLVKKRELEIRGEG